MSRSEKWLEGFKQRDLRALGKLISLAENQEESLIPLLATLYGVRLPTVTFGFTGAPGAGKSTLVNGFIKHLRQSSLTVGVIAIDPMSPFSGGAVLGDRVRMMDHSHDNGVFIRSLSNRGKLGGVSLATQETLHLMEAFGFDRILVETVGVGQSEVDVRYLADLTVVVLVPEWGDTIQSLKAGILEIGDIFVVNKADREGADRIAAEVTSLLEISKRPVRVFKTSQSDPSSLHAFYQGIEECLEQEKATLTKRRAQRVQRLGAGLLETRLVQAAKHWASSKLPAEANPYEQLLNFLKANPLEKIFQ